MEETGQWECPFYHRVVGEDECYDLFLIAMRMFEAPELVREEDCGSLNAMCEECKKYLKTASGEIKLFRPRVCACCGKSIVGFYGVCRVCGWENDPLQNERPDYKPPFRFMGSKKAAECDLDGSMTAFCILNGGNG